MNYDQKLKKLYSEAPWKWMKDWSKNQIQPEGLFHNWILLIVSIFFLAISLPLWDKFIPVFKKGDYIVLMVLFFPLIGFSILIAFIKKALTYQKFKGIHIHLENDHGTLGGQIKGQLNFPKNLNVEEHHLNLSLMKYYKRKRGNQKGWVLEEIWTTPGHFEILQSNEKGLIHFEFQTPYDLHESSYEKDETQYQWIIHYQGIQPGLDSDFKFHVPIYKSTESNPKQTMAKLSQQKEESLIKENMKFIEYSTLPNNDVRLSFAYWPKINLAITMSVFGLIFTIIGAFFTNLLLKESAIFKLFLVIPGIFLLIGGFILFNAIFLFLTRVTIDLNSNEIKIFISRFFYYRTKSIHLADIISVEAHQTASQGAKSFHDIKMETTSHGNFKIPVMCTDLEELNVILKLIKS